MRNIGIWLGRVFGFACALLFASQGIALAQGRVDIDKARASYLARNYTEAESRLRALVNPQTGAKELSLLSQARMYLSAVLLAQSQREAAVELFESMILADPQFEPDPLSFPGDVINTFFDVRGQLQEKIRQSAQNAARFEAERRARAEAVLRKEAMWLAKVKQMAGEETITVRHSRLLAWLPFGAGQFQNGDRLLGWTFLASEAVCMLGTGITVPMFLDARAHADDESRAGDLERKAQLYQDRAATVRAVNLSFAGALAALAITGVVQANLAYSPEVVERKKRPLPEIARLSPFVQPLATTDASRSGLTLSGAVIGLRGVAF